jgi:hypothetical protein
MTIFVLEVKCTLDNCTVSVGSANEWKIDVKNPLNNYEQKEGVTIQESELVEMENAHVAAAHLAVKWEGSPKYSTLNFVAADDKALKPKKKSSPSYTPKDVEESDQWTPILAVDCRGMEPCGYTLGDNEFVVKSLAGVVFEEVTAEDLGDEFCEYCDKSEQSVGVSNFEYRWTSI